MRGFTLIELILTVALMAVLAAVSAPVYQSFQVKNELDIAENVSVSSLRRARVLAQASSGDSNWGVYIQSGSITLFKGASYASRDSTYDEKYDVITAITPSGVQEFTFSKFSGDPVTTGTLTLTASTGETQTVNLNSKGMITY